MIRVTDSARAMLAVVSTFVIGFVAGCAADRAILNPPAYAVADAREGAPSHHDEVLAELRTELRLSPEQAARVQEIFRARQSEIDVAWERVHQNLQRAMQQTTQEIESVLDSAQITRLHAWLAQRHGAASRHVSGRGH